MTNPQQQQPNPPGSGIFPDDPFGAIKKDKNRPGAEPREVGQFHARSDLDSSASAQHHTLGIQHTQASPGDHSHDGRSSRKIGTGLKLTITGSTDTDKLNSLIAMLKNVIEFTGP